MVDRCVCHNVTFAELRRLAGVTGRSLDQLAVLTACGTGCGCCVPYLRLMLRTGQTTFPVLSIQAFRRLGALAPDDAMSGIVEHNTNDRSGTPPPLEPPRMNA